MSNQEQLLDLGMDREQLLARREQLREQLGEVSAALCDATKTYMDVLQERLAIDAELRRLDNN